ncbi:MAG: hypothetical protein JO243_07085 [Solirubrobacterales bacterium]|nr:hypothetical protein [Solirubrobacterales bacterium]
MTVVNPHIIKAIATERIADLRHGAAPRPEETSRARRMRRLKRPAMRARPVSTARAEQP